MPLGAMIARDEISTWARGTHGSTFGGNPVACAAALATIQLLEEGLVKNAATVGEFLKNELMALQSRRREISDVRGLGLMIGVEFERNDGSHAPDAKLRDRVMQKCFEKGLLLLSCGESTLRFCPPLIVTEKEAGVAVKLFEAAIAEAV
jgi:4-aminobutyrate aminotransferase